MDANNSLAIKKCEEHDLELLISISRQTFKDAFEHQNNPEDFKAYLNSSFSKEKLSQELQNPDSEFYFVFVNDKIAGYFTLSAIKCAILAVSVSSVHIQSCIISAS